MPTRRQIGGSFALFLVGLACGLPGDERFADGEPCLLAEECASELCRWGVCVAGTCSGESACPDGWRCVERSSGNGPLWDALFGTGGPDGLCALECEACPAGERYTCEDAVCSFDHAPHVDAGGPYQGRVGEPIDLRGAAGLVEGRTLERAEWTWGSGAPVDVISGLEASHVFTEHGSFQLRLTVRDSAQVEASATAELVVCTGIGDVCEDDWACCAGGVCEEGLCAPAPVCGNGVVERDELCDGAAPEGQSCLDFAGHDGGALGCAADCTSVDLSGCDRCGVALDNCKADSDCCPGFTCGALEWCSAG